MRLILLSVSLVFLCAGAVPAVADLRKPITGGSPVLPAVFVPFLTFEPATPPLALPEPGQPPVATGRHIVLRSDFIGIIQRIESFYDPVRLDPLDYELRFAVSPGTLSMLESSGTYWRLRDADPNVNFRSPYIAQAWTERAEADCAGFTKTLRVEAGVIVADLPPADCARLMRRQGHPQSEGWDGQPVMAAVLPVPTFGVPLPGARLSGAAFWAAQRARIAAAQQKLHAKWRPGAPVAAE